MSKEILLLGEFSTGKSAFINMLLGVSILPEKLESTDMPVIKIHGGSPAGLWLREPEQKNPKALDNFSDIPKDWTLFEYAEITIPTHPLLKEGLIFWDTPGRNSTNPHHQKHLENFLSKKKKFRYVYYFVHGTITEPSIEFLKKYRNYWDNLVILVNIKEERLEDECRLMEKEVKKTVRVHLGNIPVELLYIGDMCGEFNTLSDQMKANLSDWELLKDWDKRRIDFKNLKEKYRSTIIGEENIEVIELLGQESEVGFSPEDIESVIKAAESGNAEAQYLLGNAYQKGQGVKKDYKLAVEWYNKSAELGNANDSCALFSFGFIFEEGLGIKQDYKKALDWFTKSAEKNDAAAQHSLGAMYYYGEGVRHDYKKALEWFSKSAEQGDPNGQYGLGLLYANGEGIKQDDLKAIEWFTKSAKQGNSNAPLQLGFIYWNKESPQNDYRKAFEWLSNPAEQGNAEAQYVLGNLYDYGLGVKKDYQKAIEWYTKSAEQGNADAEYAMGFMYRLGEGTQKDNRIAFEWINKSAQHENAEAQALIGLCYQKGVGVSINANKALYWYEKAAAQGNEDAVKLLSEFNKQHELKR